MIRLDLSRAGVASTSLGADPAPAGRKSRFVALRTPGAQAFQILRRYPDGHQSIQGLHMKRSFVFVLCAIALGCAIAACGGGDDTVAKLTIVGAGS
ncbi:MAG TPA: hypothetical protein VNS61_17770 [Caldimonas sp.]|nr:hypothetical protein [Caldimonas sp.]